jgi:putative FmdB family regulatory protein
MPTYQYRCEDCGAVLEEVRPIANAHDFLECPECDYPMTKVILTAPKGFVKGNFDAFKSSVDGSLIRTNRELQEHNKRNSVVNLHDGFDEKAIMSGNIAPPKQKLNKKELAADIAESIHKVQSGYSPIRETANEHD